MYNSSKKSKAAAERSAERRRREDDAPRLSAEVPRLQTLAITVVEQGSTSATKYVRRVVVTSAPALFTLPCGDPACIDGGHDLTHEVMRALRSGQTSFKGEHTCEGMTGSASCARRIGYELIATYSAHEEQSIGRAR